MPIRLTRRLALAVLTLVVVATAEVAGAQAREFTGTVVSAGATITVEDRRGDRVSFTGTDQTIVKGRPGWNAISVGDRVIVRWVLEEGRKARRVVVLDSGS